MGRRGKLSFWNPDAVLELIMRWLAGVLVDL